MKRIKLTVAYDGTDYCGWQIQKNGITVEEVLNKALSRLTGEKITVTGASRTDAGVHAQGNVAVFDTDTQIPPERLIYALNTVLPEDVVAVKSEEVTADWHPRRRVSVKTYEYRILNRELPDPVRRRDTYFVSFPLDLERMREAAEYLKGTHDFKSFCSAQTAVKAPAPIFLSGSRPSWTGSETILPLCARRGWPTPPTRSSTSSPTG